MGIIVFNSSMSELLQSLSTLYPPENEEDLENCQVAGTSDFGPASFRGVITSKDFRELVRMYNACSSTYKL